MRLALRILKPLLVIGAILLALSLLPFEGPLPVNAAGDPSVNYVLEKGVV